MIIVWALLLVLVLLTCWGLTLVGMPGNWLMAAAAAIYWFFIPVDSSVSTTLTIGGWVVLVAVVLAGIGELLEFAAGAMGAAQKGGSRRAAAMALLGSMIGAVVGAIFGIPIPIPVVGSVIGSILFAGVGALAGAMLGEQWKGRSWRESWEVGHAAFWGRLLGTLGKIVAGSVLLVVLVGALCV